MAYWIVCCDMFDINITLTKINYTNLNNFSFFFSASTLTCDDMQLLGSGVTAMTTSQIEAVSDNDFIDCVQTLGGYSTWDSNQLLSLLTVATRTGVSGSSDNRRINAYLKYMYDVPLSLNCITTSCS